MIAVFFFLKKSQNKILKKEKYPQKNIEECDSLFNLQYLQL